MQVAEACVIVTDLLVNHDLYHEGWRFKVGRGKNTLGTCNYKKKEIRISRNHIEHGTDQEVMDTIRHEVAHALTPGAGHGILWELKARELGLKNPTRAVKVSYDVGHKYGVKCPIHDGIIAKRHRRMNPQRLASSHCIRCGREKTIGKLQLVKV